MKAEFDKAGVLTITVQTEPELRQMNELFQIPGTVCARCLQLVPKHPIIIDSYELISSMIERPDVE